MHQCHTFCVNKLKLDFPTDRQTYNSHTYCIWYEYVLGLKTTTASVWSGLVWSGLVWSGLVPVYDIDECVEINWTHVKLKPLRLCI
jgi:hypothetical protein